MSRKKYVVFAIAGAVLSTLTTVLLLVMGDLYVHYQHQVKKTGMYNIWGYRGPIVGSKLGGDMRIVVLGGSTALGYGVPVGKSFPAQLEGRLNKRRKERKLSLVSVVNLAWNNQGAYSFVPTLEDYSYLGYDIVIFYTGYNDLGGPNRSVFRRQSPIFRLTGYLPMLPIILNDKAKMLRAGLGIDDINSGRKRPEFVPNLVDRSKAYAMEMGAKIARSLEAQLGPLTDPDSVEARIQDVGCGKRWDFYCRRLHAAVNLALERGKRVIVVTQPYISDGHVEQQKQMSSMLKKAFDSAPGFQYVNLGNTVDLKNTKLAFDGMHLTPEGNRIIAEKLLPSVEKALK